MTAPRDSESDFESACTPSKVRNEARDRAFISRWRLA